MPNGGRQRESQRSQRPEEEVSPQDLKEIVEDGNAKKLNEVADRLGKFYASGQDREKLSSSQIRSVLDRLQRLGGYDSNQLQLLRPLLAYAAGRHGGKVKHLQKIVDQAIQKVNGEDKFKHFKNFFEAIVAYHRYHGEEDKR